MIICIFKLIFESYEGDLHEWGTVTTLHQYLPMFRKYINRVNAACDAEEESFDAAILFTGRADELEDVGPSKIL